MTSIQQRPTPAALSRVQQGEDTVRRGGSGDTVSAVQQLLNAHGASLTVDGKAGPLTDAAIRDFQRRQGLTVDGVVGRQTLAALLTSDAGRDAGAVTGRAPSPSPSTPPPLPAADPSAPSIYDPAPAGDVGAVAGAAPSGSLAERIVQHGESEIGVVNPMARGTGEDAGGYQGWKHLQDVFTQSTGWRPADKDIKNDATPQDKHWCGIWAIRQYQKAGVDVKWDLTRGRPTGDVAFTQRPWQRDKAAAFQQGIRPGDIITLDGKANHHAIVTGVNPDGSFNTVDGNKPGIGRDHFPAARVTGFYRPTTPA